MILRNPVAESLSTQDAGSRPDAGVDNSVHHGERVYENLSFSPLHKS